jgi:hypothetical protein
MMSFVESLAAQPCSCDALLSVSCTRLKFMSNAEATPNALVSLQCYPALVDSYSTFMASFTNICIRCSMSQLSRACIMFMTKLQPSDEKCMICDSSKIFLQKLILLSSSQHAIKFSQPRGPGFALPHSFTASNLQSGHWIGHGVLEHVDSLLTLSSKFWVRNASSAWHLLDCIGEVPNAELGLVGHTSTALPNGVIAIVGGYSSTPVECMRKIILASVDVQIIAGLMSTRPAHSQLLACSRRQKRGMRTSAASCCKGIL